MLRQASYSNCPAKFRHIDIFTVDQWIFECFDNFPFELCRLRVVFLFLFLAGSLPRVKRFLSDHSTLWLTTLTTEPEG